MSESAQRRAWAGCTFANTARCACLRTDRLALGGMYGIVGVRSVLGVNAFLVHGDCSIGVGCYYKLDV